MSPLYIYAANIVLPAQQETDTDSFRLYYHGSFNNQNILDMAQTVRKRLASHKDLSWKVFSVFVELAQNVYFNTFEHNITSRVEPLGIISVEEQDEYVTITSANLASLQNFERLQQKCTHINQLTTKELHTYKKKLLAESEDNPTYKGGNIGLVQVALHAQEKLDLQINAQETDTIFFSLKISIKK